MKVLVTGGKGQLGSEVIRQLKERGTECLGADLPDMDLTDAASVMRIVQEYSPDAVIHCAAYTDVDKAESAPEICTAINASGTVNVIRAALSVGAKLVYLSTDYVFSGEGETPWEINDPYGPKNVYGLSKMQGEDAVRSLMTRYFIVRTSWLFARNGRNFVRTMLRLGRDKKELRVVDDQVGSPTYAPDLARVLCELVQTDKYGIYHVRNEGYLSWAEFAGMIMKKAGLACRIIPVSSSEYQTPARRPLNSRLSGTQLARAGIAPLPSVEDALDRCLAEIREV